MNLVMTVQVYESQINKVVHSPVLLRHHMMDMCFLTIFEMLVTDRTDPGLSFEELPKSAGCRGGLGSPLPPVDLEGWVVRGVILGDQDMALNVHPGEFHE